MDRLQLALPCHALENLPSWLLELIDSPPLHLKKQDIELIG